MLIASIDDTRVVRSRASGRGKILLRLSLLIGLSLVAVASASADFTYKDWVAASPAWKNGFAFAAVQQLTVVVIPTEAPDYASTYGYKKCLAGTTDAQSVQQVENYVNRHPEAYTTPFVAMVMQAMHEICAPLLPNGVR